MTETLDVTGLTFVVWEPRADTGLGCLVDYVSGDGSIIHDHHADGLFDELAAIRGYAQHIVADPQEISEGFGRRLTLRVHRGQEVICVGDDLEQAMGEASAPFLVRLRKWLADDINDPGIIAWAEGAYR